MRRSGTRIEATGEGSRSSLTTVSPESGPEEPPSPDGLRAGPPQSELLSDDELDTIEDDLERAERTLGLLADDDIDPAVATDWLTES